MSPPALAAGDPAAESAPTTTDVRFLSPHGSVDLHIVGASAAVQIARGGSHDVRVRGNTLRYSVSSGSSWSYSAEIDLDRVARRIITLTVPGMHLRITNRTDEARLLVVGGRTFGILARNKTRTIGPLPVDAELIDTTGVRSRTHVVRRVHGAPGALVDVVLPPLPAGLLVPNPLGSEVRITIDHRDYGPLAAGGQLYILGLAPGTHDVELIQTATGRPFRYDAQLVARGAAAPTAGAIELRVDNQTGEILQLPAALGGFFPRPVEPDESVVMSVPTRRFQLRLQGVQSGLDYTFDVHPENGAKQSWWIERPRGQLHLVNGTGEPATVSIETFGEVQMPLDSKVRIRNVPAGRLSLTITTVTSHHTFVRKLQLKAGGDARLTVSRGGSSLLIQNRWQEPVDLAIDGSPRGRVEASTPFRVNDIAAGVHEVVAQTLVSKVREVVSVRIVDGERTTLELQPPMASLKLENRGPKPLQVVVRGIQAGVVSAGKTQSFAVRSGRMAVEVQQVGGDLMTTWFGTIAPAQQIELPNPARGSAPLVLLNTRREPITLRVGTREPVEIPAGKRLVVSDLAAGTHLIEVRGKGFTQRQRVHVAPGLPALQLWLVTELLEDTPK